MAASGLADTDKTPFMYSEELQEKERIAIDIYNTLLRYWAYDPQYICDVNANFPYFYGGAYVNSDRNLVLQVTSTIDEARGYFSEIIDVESIIFEEVIYSYAELKQQHKIIADKMDSTSSDVYISSITGVGISFSGNSVMLYICTCETGSAAVEFANKVRDSVSSFSNVLCSFTGGTDTPCTAVELGDGLHYIDSGAWYYGSAGYWAYDGGGNLGIVTTGHTGLASGSAIYIRTSAYSIQFGTIGTSFYSGSTDAAFVKRTNTSYTPSRFVPGHNFSIGSSDVMPEGTLIYSRGEKSKHKTGTVLDTNFSTVYGLTNCVLTSAAADLGDSGGVVAGSGNATTRKLVGIITGKQNSTGYLIYVKVNNVNSSLNTSIY